MSGPFFFFFTLLPPAPILFTALLTQARSFSLFIFIFYFSSWVNKTDVLGGGGVVLGGFTASQCIVVTIDYRLAPEFPYPNAAEDAVEALVWLLKEAPKYYAMDLERVAIGGTCACVSSPPAPNTHTKEKRKTKKRKKKKKKKKKNTFLEEKKS